MSWTNYHSHTYFCDGKYPPNHYATQAYRQQFAAYGFSSHAPLPFACRWSMQESSLKQYSADIQKLKDKWSGKLQLYCGLEVDYIAGKIGPQSPLIQDMNLDYCVGSVHFVEAFKDGTGWEIDGAHPLFLQGLKEIFGNNVQRAVQHYYQQIRQMVEERPAVVGHLDKIKIQNRHTPLFEETADWYREAVLQTLQTIASAGLILEVNTRGLYKKRANETYPSRWILEKAFQWGVPVTVSSDAHHPREISGQFTETTRMLKEIGYRQLHILWNDSWQPFDFDENGVIVN